MRMHVCVFAINLCFATLWFIVKYLLDSKDKCSH